MKSSPIFGITMFIISFAGLSQTTSDRASLLEFFKAERLDSVYEVFSTRPISAIVIQSKTSAVFTVVGTSQKETVVPLDHDAPSYTYFHSFADSPVQFLLKVEGTLDFEYYLLHSGDIPNLTNNARSEVEEECFIAPAFIDQTEWRAGLPEPDYVRSFHEVNHHVVHHSAGSNANTNYTQVVRDIYLYHTQVNGWSDIGYNYLIAQDGTIFAGRDPGVGSQDAVRGAHFCGANTGTLGVCLLGNYETTTPSDPAWEALQSLLSYGFLSQGLNPFASYRHPLGELGTLIGHRDGCATLCPGRNIYSMLEILKVEVIEEMEECTEAEPIALRVDTTLTRINEFVNFQAIGNYQEFRWIFEGGVPHTFSGESVSVRYPVPGTYDVTLIGQRGIASDTVFSEEIIKASYFADSPLIYPNPMSNNGVLKIDFGEELALVILHDMHGRYIDEWTTEDYPLANLNPGMYFLFIETISGVYHEKLIIR